MNTNTIQAIIEIPLDDVQSPKYEKNVKTFGDDSDTCLICGKRVDLEKAKWVHLLTSGHIVSTNEDVEKSQGFFPVGPDCAKKLVVKFTFETA